MQSREWSILIFLLLLALFLRAHDIHEVPGPLHIDEIGNGVESYSLFATGKDTSGNTLPLLVNHLDIASLEPLYVYGSIPFIWALGLNTISIRLLAVLVSVLTVLTTYLFVRELYGKDAAQLTAFFLVISPWHLVFSRVAYRGILTPLFMTLGLYCLMKARREKKYFIFAGLVFGCALYTYSIAKLLVPLTLFFVFFWFGKSYIRGKNFLYILIGGLFLVLLATPIYLTSFFGEGNDRFHSMSVLSSQNPAWTFTKNYVSHFSPSFLFFSGDANERHSVPGQGMALYVMLLFLPIFLLSLEKKNYTFALVLFLFGLLPSALTTEGIPHALRAIGAVPFVELMGALGAMSLVSRVQNKKTLGVVLALLITVNGLFMVFSYFDGVRDPSAFNAYEHEAFSYAKTYGGNYNEVIISEDIPHAMYYALFYTPWEITSFQEIRELPTYRICEEMMYECYAESKGALFIARDNELSDKHLKLPIYDLSGEPVLKVVGGMK